MRKYRESMLKNLCKSLIQHGRIKTTLAKAKDVRPYIEKLITRSKENNLHNLRILKSKLQNDVNTVKKLFEIGAKNININGGYTRIVRSGFSAAGFIPQAIIEIIDRE